MTIGVDIDGVLADYQGGLRQLIAEDRGVDPETLTMDTDWYFPQWGLDAEGWRHYHNLGVKSGLLARLDVIVEAKSVLKKLRQGGCRIRILTQRGATGGQVVKLADTVKWLADKKIPFDEFTQVRHKTSVECDWYVEDSPEHIEALRAAGKRVIAFDQPWNRQTSTPHRAHSWADVYDIIMPSSPA